MTPIHTMTTARRCSSLGSRHTVMMSPEDEYDIRDSFHVMDEQKTGEISVDEFHTLCLGLGYNLESEELDSSIRQQTSTPIVKQQHCITVDIALVILSKYSRDREQELVKGFRLLDTNQSGKITAHDLMKLSQEMGEPLTFNEAKAVMSNGDWTPADFARFMSSK